MTADCGFQQISDSEFQIADCRLQISDISDCRLLQILDFRFQTADSGFQIADFRFQIISDI
jgi:hypothetical protein